MQQHSNLTQMAPNLKKRSFIGSVFDSQIKRNLIFIQARDQGYELFHEVNRNLRVQVHAVKAQHVSLQDTLDIYEWRFGTEMPIVRTYHVEIRESSQQFVYLHVFNEHLKMRLDKLYEVPFNQMLYLLRESAIGFQRIFNKFGGFELTANMIGVNQKSLCKVWYNQNAYSNLIRPNELSEEQFINNLLTIFQQRTLKTNQGKIFFKSVYGQVTTFLDLMKYVDQFIRHYKTKVPTKFTLNCSSQLRGTLRRNSLKCQKEQQRLRNTFSNGLKNSIHASYNKSNLISSLKIDKHLNGKKSQVRLQEAGIIKTDSFSNLYSNQKESKIAMVTSILNNGKSVMKTSNQSNGMKVSNQTTIAHTIIDPTKLSTSNNFSIHDFSEQSKKHPHSPSQKKITTKSNLKTSSEIELSSSDIGHGRHYSTDKTGENAFNNRFPIQKSYEILNTPKVIDIDHYQESQTQIHEVTIEEEEKQNVSNSNSNSNTNSQEKMDSIYVNIKKPIEERVSKISCLKQSDSFEDLQKSKHKAEQILQKNGWRNQLGGILTSKTPMKKSVQIGKEVNLQNQLHQFQYLKTPNLKIYESFIPNTQNQQFNDHDIAER